CACRSNCVPRREAMLSDPPAPARSLPPLHASAAPQAPDRPVAIPLGWTTAASRLLTALFLLVALEALYTVPKYTWDLAVGNREAIGILLGLGFTAAAAALLWALRYRLAAWAQAAGERLAAIPARRWLLLVTGIGLASRVAWVIL